MIKEHTRKKKALFSGSISKKSARVMCETVFSFTRKCTQVAVSTDVTFFNEIYAKRPVVHCNGRD